MNERDELALILVNGQRARYDLPPRTTTEHCSESCWAQVDAILTAGYRKTYTVTTVAELDALPRLSVVRPSGNLPAVFEKHTMWHEAGSRDLVWSVAIPLPATVLHEGEGGE